MRREIHLKHMMDILKLATVCKLARSATLAVAEPGTSADKLPNDARVFEQLHSNRYAEAWQDAAIRLRLCRDGNPLTRMRELLRAKTLKPLNAHDRCSRCASLLTPRIHPAAQPCSDCDRQFTVAEQFQPAVVGENPQPSTNDLNHAVLAPSCANLP
jgi:hypothetical protein